MKTSVLKTSFPPANLLNPLPVVMVSCGSTPEEHNIITVAWCGTVCSDPPMCYISIRPERHSYTIIKKNREFVINLVSKNLTAITDWCGVRSGKKYRKFEKMMITPIAAEKIKAPMIAESPVNIECVVKEIIPLGSHDMFIADIVAIHASEKYLNPTTQALELSNANLVSYNHGHYYCLGKEIGKFGFSVEKKK
ncbi:MAG TPA: flavin reductase family protein [Bacteroidales bacterium]|jgi:flavin reductase (DIM6/NTAB) family NADH-FMN oxidoreductase RutF|nr:flavin reductase family protein [Bacteroidales bacterium]HOR81067.1 flavin reductase family protein [Bacteroidales bacterium]HPJ91122.1 flavin reductase family protein [Bacteroidales bacterium]